MTIIECDPINTSLVDAVDAAKATLTVTRWNRTQFAKWKAELVDAVFKREMTSENFNSYFGVGETPQEAINDLSLRVQGQVMIVNPHSADPVTLLLPAVLKRSRVI